MKKFLIIYILASLCSLTSIVYANDTIQINETKLENTYTTALQSPKKEKYNNLCSKADTLIEKKKYKQAISIANKAIKLEPKFDKAYAIKSRGLVKSNKLIEAKNNAQKALSINPNNYVANNVMGVCVSILEKNSIEAIKYFDKALQINPNYFHSLINRASIYNSQDFREYNKAIDDANKAIKNNENNYLGYLIRGEAYFSLNDVETALKDFEKVILIEPKELKAYTYRAMCYSRVGNSIAALSDINKIIKEKPNEVSYYLTRLFIYSNIKASKNLVLKDLQIAETLANNNIDLLLNIAYWNYRFNEYNHSLEIIKKILEIEPNNKKAILYLALIETGIKNYNIALSHFESTNIELKGPEYSMRAIAKLGVANLGIEQKDKNLIKSAINDLNKGIEFNQNVNYNTFAIKGAAYIILEEYDVGLLYLKKALELNPNCTFTLYWKGFAEFKIDDKEAAYNSFKKIVDIDNSDIPAMINMLTLSKIPDLNLNDLNKVLTALKEERVPISTSVGYINYVILPYKNAVGDYTTTTDLDEMISETIMYLKVVYSIYNNTNILETLREFLQQKRLYDTVYIKNIISNCDNNNIDLITDIIIDYLENNPPTHKLYENEYKEIYTKLGDVKLNNKKIDDAYNCYSKAIKFGLPEFDIYKIIGNNYSMNNEFFSAIEFYDKALKIKKATDLLINRGCAKGKLNDYDGAIADFTSAIQMNKLEKDAYYNRGQTYFVQRKYRLALNDFIKVSNLDRKEPIAHYNAGICLYNLNRKELALPYFEKARDLFQKQGDYKGYNNCIDLINEIKNYR